MKLRRMKQSLVTVFAVILVLCLASCVSNEKEPAAATATAEPKTEMETWGP